MTGFMLFKEISTLMLDYFRFMNFFQNVVKKDKFNEKYYFINCAVDIYNCCISVNLFNFSVCEYYQDMIFVDLSKVIFTLFSVQDY